MPTHANRADLLRFRLASQRIAGSELRTHGEVVRHLLAAQAQDFSSASWALGLRAPGTRHTDLLDALSRGEIVRSWPMRGTLHFVAANDLGWMLTVTTERMLAGLATRHRQLQLDDAEFGRARGIVEQALRGGTSLGRDELMALFERHGMRTSGQRGYHLIYYLAQTGVICWGPPLKNQQSLVLCDEWIPAPRVMQREAALGEFVRRYLIGHGPATIRDFAWWSKLTLAEARLGLEIARSELAELIVDDTSYWMAQSNDTQAPPAAPPTAKPRRAGLKLLPGFDEYLLGYQERREALEPEFAQRVVPGGNGVFLPMMVVRGRVVGTWRRSESASKLTIQPHPFTRLAQVDRTQLATESRRYAKYWGLGVAAA